MKVLGVAHVADLQISFMVTPFRNAIDEAVAQVEWALNGPGRGLLANIQHSLMTSTIHFNNLCGDTLQPLQPGLLVLEVNVPYREAKKLLVMQQGV